MFHSPIVAGGGVEPSPIRLRVLSLGAGVQSTTLALMAAHGHFGPLDCAIFADTGWEPAAVYEHLRWLMSPDVLPFPVHIVSARNLRESLIAAGNGKRWASIPAFTRTVDRRGNVSIGMIRRQCTTTSKIEPIRRKVRELAGLTRKRSPTYPVVHQWLGISMDEVVRMKPSRAAWQLNRFPLIESRMTRKDCLAWLKSHGYPKPPKSACIGCPFHSDAMWRSMRNNDRAAWDDAVEVDRAIRTGLRGIRGEVFLHRSGVPLDEADLSTAADHGQLDLWPNECEGMCGL
ncbi:hypothetical protein LRP31_34525 (plasmid) [Mesorhizobium mediterraneum]|uniref:Phosphoadenosine phosphosulfate reductase n=1 Tax=Mesorhizobium mediterraneum TaxID=43617 RepID=A0AB36RHA5_9HYPH|nr:MULTISPECIES: hypothetical protein [Mesorhizobium]PAQ04317.1 hypothetical protein CIT25_00285 [Mesorhizobium mediterraneum]RWN24615.1 MAG: hypothetical protein EOR95_31835 [Mesorhizobium sp.]RWN28302.1 MAG: hypothetical protein EOR96_32810 [Mesorhizobium sp.]WIW57209.1 hypothetical protein LRP31_34525 [Mesorhizobium mediterraneum]